LKVIFNKVHFNFGIYLLIGLFSNCMYAQKQQQALEVNYIVYNNIPLKSQNDIGTFELRLIFTDSIYRYQHVETINTSEWQKKTSGFHENVLEPFTIGRVGSNKQFKIAKDCESGRKVVILDSIPPIDWKLTGVNKIIMGHECEEALGVYRGRPIKVYFTQEIPVPLGPYKIIGLPGLVLEMSSLDGDFRYIASSLKTIYGIDYSKFRIPNYLKVKTFKSYIECIDRDSAERLRIGDARLKSLINSVNSDGKVQVGTEIQSSIQKFGLELIYEWEIPENDKKKK